MTLVTNWYFIVTQRLHQTHDLLSFKKIQKNGKKTWSFGILNTKKNGKIGGKEYLGQR
jgi:hypothetical protein